MPHVIWKGAISFGLVHIPVRLYSAETRNSFDLTMMDRRNMNPVGFKRYNKKTGEEVPQDQIVKGYEYDKDRFVILTDADFHRASIEATQIIDIIRFVEADEVAPSYCDTLYYLAPEERAAKSYILLRDILRHTHRLGITTVVIHTRQYVAALLPLEELIVMNTLRYANEIKAALELALPSKRKSVGVTAKEKEMAIKLVEEMTGAWNPEEYHDTYHEDLLRLINKRIHAGQTEVMIPDAPEDAEGEQRRGKVVDLTALLKGSLRARSSGGQASGSRRSGLSARARRKQDDLLGISIGSLRRTVYRYQWSVGNLIDKRIPVAARVPMLDVMMRP